MVAEVLLVVAAAEAATLGAPCCNVAAVAPGRLASWSFWSLPKNDPAPDAVREQLRSESLRNATDASRPRDTYVCADLVG